MTAPDADVCVLCGRPMDGFVNELEVRINGGDVARACDEECPPAVDDWNTWRLTRLQEAAALDREIAALEATRERQEFDLDLVRAQVELMERHSQLLGLDAPRRVEVTVDNPPATMSVRDIVRKVRSDRRREDEAT